MKAVIFEQSGRAEDVLSVGDVAPPSPGPDQVLIKVAARPIHPADFMFIAGRYRVKPAFTQVAGFDGAGTVIACGQDVTGLEPGMRVAFRSPGSWAELAVAPVSRVYPVPRGIPDDIACQFPLNPLTAWGLLAECDLPAGGRILATAGRSGLVRILAALAQRRNLHLTLLVREGPRHVAVEAESGNVISNGASVADALRGAIVPGRFHAILDAVGGEATSALIDALEPNGRLISYGVLDDGPITMHASALLKNNTTWSGFGIEGWLAGAPPQQLSEAHGELWTLLAEQPDLVPVIGSFALDDVQKAIRLAQETRQPGKVLLS